MEDSVSTFGFKPEFLILTARDAGHALTEIKDIILPYPPITKIIVESHYEIMWVDNSGAGLGQYPTANYGAAPGDP